VHPKKGGGTAKGRLIGATGLRKYKIPSNAGT